MDYVFPLVRSKSLKDQTYEILRSSIITGRLEPGRLHNEKDLARRLGVSRTPVREALLDLSKEGMIVFVPRKGIKIRKITHKDVSDVMELRRIIEGYIIESCSSQLTPEDLKRIGKIIEKQMAMGRKGDRKRYVEADRKFHMFLASKIGNRQLQNVMENLRDLLHFMAIKAIAYKERMEQVLKEHERIWAALKNRDQKKAREAMLLHLDTTEKILFAAIEADEGEAGERMGEGMEE